MTDGTLGVLPLHIPVEWRIKELKSRDGRSNGVAVCSCGVEGPPVPPGEGAKAALARKHTASEPAACADCGWPTPFNPTQDPVTQYPWRRYHPVQRDGRWTYVCMDSGACHQRQLAPAGTRVGEDLVEAIDPLWDGFRVGLDTSGLEIESGQLSITPATALFQLARAHSPRTWDEVTTADERALTSLTTAVFALRAAADDAGRYAVLAARKAGASWSHLAQAAGWDEADRFRTWYLDKYQPDYDWPPEQRDEILRLLEPDPEEPNAHE